MKLYFVSGRAGWETVCAAHYLANSPKAAIALLQASISNEAKALGITEWKATISKANPADMAVNFKD